ncbi:MAG: hypothetical protein J7K23_03585 [Thermoproteales archaeon]|nr:hypothetical protein [Thermoproteales archaeon]
MLTGTIIKNREEVFKPGRLLHIFSPYSNGYYFCSLCHRWWPKEKVVFDKNGRPVCPVCRKQLRTRPRKKYKQTSKKPRLPKYWPRCPNCGATLSQKLFSDRLVCLKCGVEYELVEVEERDE